MTDKQFFNNLSATYADVRKLDVKKINLKGKNILEYIKESVPVILDERGTKANDELDIWNSYVTKDVNGNVIINRDAKPFEHTQSEMTQEQTNTIKNAKKIINNQVLDADDNHLMFWQTDGLTDGNNLIGYNKSLDQFSSDLSSLTSGASMFLQCDNLTTFISDLISLTNGRFMFSGCDNLTTFIGDSSGLPVNLSSLTDGDSMFSGCSNLASFTSDLSSLTSGDDMFTYCENLTTFNSDLSSLTSGRQMFSNCKKLTQFTSPLSSLTDGFAMFSSCKLDATSVANILHFIPQRDTKDVLISIGIGITNTDAAKQAFAEECYCDNWQELLDEFSAKNWVVAIQCNGEATTFDLRSPKPSTAVYAKLEEVTMPTNEKEHKPRYAYTSQDGSKFYNIHWYHDSNTNNEGYDYFESLEEAISAYGVIHK